MILLRHTESEFNAVYNATFIDPGIADPRLTEAGRRQAVAVVRSLARRKPKRLLTSPYTRALETAEIIATALDVGVAVEPLVRERRGFSCDIGTRRSMLARRWPGLDFDELDEQWWPDELETDEALAARCAAFCAVAASWPDADEVAVVSHWGFILALTGQSVHNGEFIAFDPASHARLVR